MIVKKKSLIHLSLYFFGLLACKKEGIKPTNNPLSELPPATQSGANTFGCFIDGNVLVSNKSTCTYIQTTQLATNNYFNFTLIAVDSTSASKQTISFFTPGISMLKDNTTITLQTPANTIDRWYADYSNVITAGITMDYQTTFAPSNGSIFFSHVDTVNKVLSGTFAFKAVESDNEIISATSGRFDVRYTSN
jgi:hypothetical protein